MHKKLMTTCMVIAAVAALIIAPAASASPVLTSEGRSVPVGTKVIATNTGNATFTFSGGLNVVCDHVKLTGEVTKNSGTVIEETFSTKDFNGTGSGTDCTSNSILGPVKVTMGNLCVKDAAAPADTPVFTGCGAAVSATFSFTGAATCKYSETEVKAAFTTNSPPITMNPEEEGTLVEGGAFCATRFKLDMTYDSWTDSAEGREVGNPIVVS